MLGHHGGIIDALKSVLIDSKHQFKPQLLELSREIITDQKEIIFYIPDGLIPNTVKFPNFKQPQTQQLTQTPTRTKIK